MNNKQWWVLIIGTYALSFLLMYSVSQALNDCLRGPDLYSMSCIRWQSFAPFPYVLNALGLIFILLWNFQDKSYKGKEQRVDEFNEHIKQEFAKYLVSKKKYGREEFAKIIAKGEKSKEWDEFFKVIDWAEYFINGKITREKN